MPRLDSRNLRKHSDRNKALIRKSLEEVGAGRSILLDADDTVIAGNGVLTEAEAMGIPVQVVESDGKTLIALKRTDLSGAKARRAAFLDNATGDSSAYDYDVELLRQLATEDDVVKRIVEEDATIAALLKNETPEFKEYDESIAEGISICKCQVCGHEHAKKN